MPRSACTGNHRVSGRRRPRTPARRPRPCESTAGFDLDVESVTQLPADRGHVQPMQLHERRRVQGSAGRPQSHGLRHLAAGAHHASERPEGQRQHECVVLCEATSRRAQQRLGQVEIGLALLGSGQPQEELRSIHERPRSDGPAVVEPGGGGRLHGRHGAGGQATIVRMKYTMANPSASSPWVCSASSSHAGSMSSSRSWLSNWIAIPVRAFARRRRSPNWSQRSRTSWYEARATSMSADSMARWSSATARPVSSPAAWYRSMARSRAARERSGSPDA